MKITEASYNYVKSGASLALCKFNGESITLISLILAACPICRSYSLL